MVIRARTRAVYGSKAAATRLSYVPNLIPTPDQQRTWWRRRRAARGCAPRAVAGVFPAHASVGWERGVPLSNNATPRGMASLMHATYRLASIISIIIAVADMQLRPRMCRLLQLRALPDEGKRLLGAIRAGGYRGATYVYF